MSATATSSYSIEDRQFFFPKRTRADKSYSIVNVGSDIALSLARPPVAAPAYENRRANERPACRHGCGHMSRRRRRGLKAPSGEQPCRCFRCHTTRPVR